MAGVRNRGASGAVALTVGLSFLTLAGPFLAAPTPPLTDYPNHLARYWLIAGGAADPALAAFYRIDWSNAVTNLGVDHAIAWLAPFFSAQVLGYAAAVLAAVLPPLGLLALNGALHRRLTPWQALFPLASWSTTLLMGFLNFQIGLGLALLFAALDPLVHPDRPRWQALMRVPLGLILATDHMFALGFYAVLLAGLAFGPAPVKLADRALLRTRLARAAGAAAWTLAPLAILALYRHPLPGAETAARAVGHVTLLDALRDKAATVLTPLASYNLAQEAVLGLTLAALVAWLWRRRILAGHAGLVLAAAGLFVLAIVLPERLMGASWIDRRFPVMALFALLAALQTRIGLPRRAALELGATGLALAVLQAAWIGWTWQAMTRDMDAVREVLAHAPAGARIVPVQHHPALQVRWRAPAGRYMFAVGDPTFRHYDALAVPERRAFVPNLFSARGLQPLRVLGDWDGVVEHNGGDLASIDALVRAPRPDEARYLDRWRERFDYVLVLNADLPDQAGPFRPPPGLTRVAVTRFAELWRIGPPGGRHGPSVRRSA